MFGNRIFIAGRSWNECIYIYIYMFREREREGGRMDSIKTNRQRQRDDREIRYTFTTISPGFLTKIYGSCGDKVSMFNFLHKPETDKIIYFYNALNPLQNTSFDGINS